MTEQQPESLFFSASRALLVGAGLGGASRAVINFLTASAARTCRCTSLLIRSIRYSLLLLPEALCAVTMTVSTCFGLIWPRRARSLMESCAASMLSVITREYDLFGWE